MFTIQNICKTFTKFGWIVTEKSQCQPKTNIALRCADTLCFTFIGAIGGVLLTTAGSLISGSVVGIAAAVTVGFSIGVYAGGMSGSIVGALYGALAAGVGSLISRTPLAVMLTIVACACLAAWCTWAQRDIVFLQHDSMGSDASGKSSYLSKTSPLRSALMRRSNFS